MSFVGINDYFNGKFLERVFKMGIRGRVSYWFSFGVRKL